MLPSAILPYIPTFVKVVELEGFSKAATELGLTKSAVSKQVQALEDALKVKLLNRTTRTIKLTEAGEAFYTNARLMCETLDHATRSVQDMRAKPSGTLTINAPESFGLFHLSPALVEFAQLYPDVDLDVTFTDRYINVMEENVDVAIRVGALTDSSLMAKKLAPCQFITAATQEYIDANGAPTHPDELITHRFIGYSYAEKPREWRYIGPDGETGVAAINVHFKGNNGQMLRQAALAGLGIISVPSFIIGNDVKKGKLVPVLAGYQPAPARSIYAIFPPNRYQSAKLRAFLDFIGERFAGTPYWEV